MSNCPETLTFSGGIPEARHRRNMTRAVRRRTVSGIGALVVVLVGYLLFFVNSGDGTRIRLSPSTTGGTDASRASRQPTGHVPRVIGRRRRDGRFHRRGLVDPVLPRDRPGAAPGRLPVLVVLDMAATLQSSPRRSRSTVTLASRTSDHRLPSSYTDDLTWNVDFASCCQRRKAEHR